MTSQPKIVILEDERPQLLVVRASLRGLGQIEEFTDPKPALAFLKEHTVDVAIVDIHMPRFSIDGMDFIRSVRNFDKDLCVIIRTGDASPDVADGAIEVGAFRRAIKGKTSIDELRELTMAAVRETRTRRQVSLDAANTSAVKTQWVETLGSVEEVLSVTDSYRGLLQGMRNQLTAIAGVAEVMGEAADRNQSKLLHEFVTKNKGLVRGLLKDVNEFLDGPFAETLHSTPSEARGTVNGVLASLRKHFLASPKWVDGQNSLSIADLSEDLYVAATPVRLLTAIRHLLEFCLERSAPNSATRLTAYCVDRVTSAIESISGPKVVFTEQSMNQSGISVAFRVSSYLPAISIEDIRRQFHDYPEKPHSGNLQMIPLALRNALAAVAVYSTPSEATVFELYLPLSR